MIRFTFTFTKSDANEESWKKELKEVKHFLRNEWQYDFKKMSDESTLNSFNAITLKYYDTVVTEKEYKDSLNWLINFCDKHMEDALLATREQAIVRAFFKKYKKEFYKNKGNRKVV